MSRVLIRLPNWLGDAVMASAAIRDYCENNPSHHVSLLGIPLTLSVFAAWPQIHSLIVYDRKGDHAGFIGTKKLVAEIKKQNFAISYLLTNSFSSAAILYWARIPTRVGYAGQWRTWLLTHTKKQKPGLVHQIDKYAYVLSQASRPTSQPIIHIAEEEALYAQEFLHKHNLLTEPLVAMAVGAAYGSAKRWLPERYAQVAKWCVKELNSRVIFLGSKAEYSQIDEIQQQAGPGTYNMAGQLSIRQTFAVLQRCRVVVCNDSGLMHAAAALGVPIVALFGPTSVEETGPVGVAQTIIQHPIECAPCFERECPLQHHQCMKNISIEEVQQAIEKNVLI